MTSGAYKPPWGVRTPVGTRVGGEDPVRITIYVPDDLGEQVRSADMNVSAVAQEALRQRLGCTHDHLSCAGCGDVLEHSDVAGAALAAFYDELLWAFEPLVDRGGTAEGAARVAKSVALQHGVERAETIDRKSHV